LKPQLCIYCNHAVADTVDHIPPKLLLAKPYPDNLLTVPSCFKCNSSFQKHDEYTRVIASIDVRNARHKTVKVNMPAILRSLEKPEAQGFSKYLASKTTPTTPGVTAPEPKPMIQQLALLYSTCTDRRAKAVGDVFNYVAAFHTGFSVWLLVLYDEFAWAATITDSDHAAVNSSTS